MPYETEPFSAEPELVAPLKLTSHSEHRESSSNETNSFENLKQSSAGKRRALVVDDAPDVTEMLAMLLSYVGYETVAAFSAAEALEIAQTRQFDIIVSDIGMPGMNGYELAEALRRIPNYESVPMVAVTGFAMYDDRDRAFESGFNAFMTKPVNPLALLELLHQFHS